MNVSHNVTRKSIRYAIQSRKIEEEEGTQKILGILMTYGSCSPHQIKKHLDESARQTAQSRYENGEINKEQIEKIVEENSMVRETIQRKLKKLVTVGKIVKNDTKYSLSEISLTDIRFFDPKMGKEYGFGFLLSLLGFYFPIDKDLKTRVKEIISILGFYLFYSLIESCRPINFEFVDKNAENKTKDYIAYQWFSNSLNPTTILDSFISLISREFNYKDRNSFIEEYSDLIGKGTVGSFEAYCLKKRFLKQLSGETLTACNY